MAEAERGTCFGFSRKDCHVWNVLGVGGTDEAFKEPWLHYLTPSMLESFYGLSLGSCSDTALMFGRFPGSLLCSVVDTHSWTRFALLSWVNLLVSLLG